MIQFLRGTTAANDAYTGPVGSLTVDTEVGTIRVHDGVTAGGWVIATVDDAGGITSVSGTSPIVISGTTTDPVVSIQQVSDTQDGYLTSADKVKLDSVESGAQVNTVDSVNGQTGAVTIPEANATTVGLVSTGDQTFAGNKTFSGVLTIDEGTL